MTIGDTLPLHDLQYEFIYKILVTMHLQLMLFDGHVTRCPTAQIKDSYLLYKKKKTQNTYIKYLNG